MLSRLATSKPTPQKRRQSWNWNESNIDTDTVPLQPQSHRFTVPSGCASPDAHTRSVHAIWSWCRRRGQHFTAGCKTWRTNCCTYSKSPQSGVVHSVNNKKTGPSDALQGGLSRRRRCRSYLNWRPLEKKPVVQKDLLSSIGLSWREYHPFKSYLFHWINKRLWIKIIGNPFHISKD